MRALFDANIGKTQSAIIALHTYEQYATSNPFVNALLSRLYQKRDKPDLAELYAFRCLYLAPTNQAQERYRSLIENRPSPRVEEIRRLQTEAQSWTVSPSEGLVTLLRDQRFSVARRGWHLKTCRELIEVRRTAAGRFLRSLGFSFSQNEHILFTGATVIHGNGELEKVESDHFTVSDSRARNIFIAVEDQKVGHWILPDLAPGDVIEWTYHLMCWDYERDKDPEFFILTNLFDPEIPTFRARAEFTAPRDLDLQMSWRNGAPEPVRERTQDGRDTSLVFTGLRHMPVKNTNFYFDHYHLNPILVCGCPRREWPEASMASLALNFGEVSEEDALPEPLLQAMDGAGEPEAALERAFYWIRDKLRYASLESGRGRVGDALRAAEIVESGTGNCKDKSYLLSMVCRHSGLPWEYVAISTRNGILIEDVPANQFDHVFVRARAGGGGKRDGRWLYMDAANSLSPFGSPPSWCQGLQAMVLDEKGTVISIPADPPEANRIEVRETIEGAPEGWLTGSFDFRATGHCGRLVNENVKGFSLSMNDAAAAAQGGLAQYLPYLVVHEFSVASDTGSSNVFQVVGRHRRSRLATLEGTRKRIGRLSWIFPGLPLYYWRNFRRDRIFAVDFPAELDVTVVLGGDLGRDLEDVSRVKPVENEYFRVQESVERAPEATTIRRVLTWKERFVRGPMLERLDTTLEALEESCLLVMSFR